MQNEKCKLQNENPLILTLCVGTEDSTHCITRLSLAQSDQR